MCFDHYEAMFESTDIGQNDEIFSVGSTVNYRWSRKLSGAIDIKYIDNDSSVNTLDYTEKSIFVSVV